MKSRIYLRRLAQLFEGALLLCGALLLLKSGYSLAKYPLFAFHPQWFGARATASFIPARFAPPSLHILGRLTIPRLGESVLVVDGDDEQSLSVAAGHVPGTAPLDGSGNSAIAGHRDTVFRALRKVRPGDEIEVRTDRSYVYSVKSMRIVMPDDVTVLKPSDERMLTLVTCFPFSYAGDAPQRYIVLAKLARIVP